MREMIRIQGTQGIFHNRIVGVVLHQGHVLLHRNIHDDFWALPGGRGEVMEPSEITIQREFQEELGVTVSVERLLWLVENFFSHENLPYHELAMYYLLSIQDNSLPRNMQEEFTGIEHDVQLIFRWFPLEELEHLPLYPSFLRTALQELPTTIQHIRHYDEPEE
ncbi:NUDIX hydrolase [Brevibacillus ginsengisoli]|uniref:NUDIX hydrolase n=1 Tax=Brevibacillus ginsengisoli TaxID=363854 RepID=UPI003CF89B53